MRGKTKKALIFLVIAVAVNVTALIRAEFRNARTHVYMFKPLSTLLVITIAVLSFFDTQTNVTFSIFVVLGLLFSFVGDVALMFQENRKAFLIGLVAFLIGHVAYAIGFSLFTGMSNLDILTIALLLAAGLGFYQLLKPNLGSMKIPVILYMLIISIMVNRAFAAFESPAFGNRQAWMIAMGALLFYLSDVMLAANKFWRPWRYSRLSLALYYAGQVLIALSAHQFSHV